MELNVLNAPAHIGDNNIMTTAIKTSEAKPDSLAPYTILGSLLGMLPVFFALVLTDLPL